MTAITLEIMALALEGALIRLTSMEWECEVSETPDSIVFIARGAYVHAAITYPVGEFWNSSDANHILDWITKKVLRAEGDAIEEGCKANE